SLTACGLSARTARSTPEMNSSVSGMSDCLPLPNDPLFLGDTVTSTRPARRPAVLAPGVSGCQIGPAGAWPGCPQARADQPGVGCARALARRALSLGLRRP